MPLSPPERSLLPSGILQVSSRLVFPVLLLFAAAHVVNADNSPGEGFSSGLLLGLAIVLLYVGLGVRPSLTAAAPNDALALLLFLLAVPVFSFFITPLFAQMSRRHEFEADAYAVAQTSGSDLGTALLKLYEDNASTLTPDPIHSAFYDSHPPAAVRIARLAAVDAPVGGATAAA